MNFFQRLLGKREPILEPADLSILGTDMHSHLLPGLDDGIQNIEETLDVIRAFVGFGYKKLITTPHIMGDFYKNTPEQVKKELAKLKQIVSNEGIEIELECAAEYYVDFEFEKLVEETELLTFGNNYLLFEFSYINTPINYKSIVFQMQSKGYRPVLAHPERYAFWYNDFAKLTELKDLNVLFQLNINSLFGYYSKPAMLVANKLLDENMVSFIGTDTHGMRHINIIKQNLRNPMLHKAIQAPNLLNKLL